MSYRTMFREAVGEIPPTSIDVDGVIARQRRALRLRRLAVVTAAAAAVGAMSFGAVAVTGRPAAELPTGPSPTNPAVRIPAPAPGESFTPTDTAIFAAVGRVAPDLEWGAPQGAGRVWDSGPTTRGYAPNGYYGSGWVRSGDRTGELSVQITSDWGTIPPCAADAVSKDGCATTTGPGGEKIRTSSIRDRDQGAASRGRPPVPSVRKNAFVERTDGVVLILTVEGQDEDLPLTVAQLTALALDPAVAEVAAEPLRFDAGAQRMSIDSAVLAALQREAPGVRGAAGRGPVFTPNDLGAGWSSRGGAHTGDAYQGQGRILVSRVAGLFSVRIHRGDPGPSGNLSCEKPSRTDACEAGTGPNGERYRTVTRNGAGASAERTVYVLRRDGSWLVVTLGADGKGRFALTAAQQQAVAFDPAVALAGR
ncbi:hypothetical protein [Micromonospora sp. NPDC023956]|uniref:hypothetical protein n=1 Tax=Micromonospora sp. NPDC023956 TaxID=3155722 RepID=UPI0033CD187B